MKPIIASGVLAPVALWAARTHVLAGVLAGAGAYFVCMKLTGGLTFGVFEFFPARGPHSRIDRDVRS
jgi:hypothetical protein